MPGKTDIEWATHAGRLAGTIAGVALATVVISLACRLLLHVAQGGQ